MTSLHDNAPAGASEEARGGDQRGRALGGVVSHRVAAAQRDPFELCVMPDQFAAHLLRVRAMAPIVPLDELLEPAPGAALVYRAPMTRSGRVLEVGGEAIPVRLWHRRSRFETIAAVHGALRPLPPATIDASLDELEQLIGDGTASVAGTDRASHIPPRLDADGVRALAASPNVTIGAHTRPHPWLASLSLDEERAEIEAGRDTLHDVLGDAPTTFAYPYGELESFDDITPSLVAAAGFVSAWTTEGGAFGAVADRFRLPPCPVGTRSPDDLAAELCEWIA